MSWYLGRRTVDFLDFLAEALISKLCEVFGTSLPVANIFESTLHFLLSKKVFQDIICSKVILPKLRKKLVVTLLGSVDGSWPYPRTLVSAKKMLVTTSKDSRLFVFSMSAEEKKVLIV